MRSWQITAGLGILALAAMMAVLLSPMPGSTTGARAGAAGGSITGTVTEEITETPLANVCVAVIDPSGPDSNGDVYGAITDASGGYVVEDLPGGEYKLWFLDCGLPGFHVSEWYDDQRNFASAGLVVVVEGSETSAIDSELAVGGGAIRGRVTEEATGLEISRACVIVNDPLDLDPDIPIGVALTDESGFYVAGGLRPGSYVVRFLDACNQGSTHLTEFYNDARTASEAALVSVAEGATTEGIDAALTEAGIGDVDCGGSVSAVDATLILQFDAGLVNKLSCSVAADTSGDNRINAIDAALILQFEAGIVPSLSLQGDSGKRS